MAIRTIIIWLLFAATAFANQKDINFIQKINPKVEYNEALTISNLTREYSSKYQLDPNLVHPLLNVQVGEIWQEMEPRLPENRRVVKTEIDWSVEAPQWHNVKD